MLKPDDLPEDLDGKLSPELEAAMRQEEPLRDEVLRHRRMERALRVMLAPESRTIRLKDSIQAAVQAAPLADLREQVIAHTSRPRRARWTPQLAWAAGIAAILVVTAMLMLRDGANDLRMTETTQGAEVLRGGQDLAAAPGMKLVAGDEIHVGGSSVTLRFSEEATAITLESQTAVRIVSLAPQKRFELLQGGVEADVARQSAGAMLWTTDNAEARVLGTKFALTADGVFTRLDVEKGAVELQRLGASEQTLVRAGEFAATDAQSLLPARSQQAEPVWNVTERQTPGFEHVAFVSETAGMEMGVNVLLPPRYAEFPESRLPVLYFLHDTGGDEHTEAARFGPLLRDAMTRRELPPFIAVFPNVGPGYTPKPWVMAEVLARDLTRFIDERYRTRPVRDARIVCGIGQGGHRALMLATMQSRLFAACGVFDDPLRGGPPGIRQLLERSQGRWGRFDRQMLLLHSAAYPPADADALGGFLQSLGTNVQTRELPAPAPRSPAYANAVWAELRPWLAAQWQR